jgi:PhnB protein
MSSRLNPYISFHDNAKQAMEFYKEVFGGELVLNTFADLQAPVEPGEQDLIMHAQLETSSGYTLMASDTPQHMDYSPGSNFSVSLSGDDADGAELRGYFEKLADGGEISMPLEPAPWGDSFGMLKDKFGIQWLVNISGPAA